MKTRPAACLAVLQKEYRALRKLNDRNQKQFSSASGNLKLTRAQMHLLTETVFFGAFRAYEQFLRNVFLLYCSGQQPSGRKLARTFLQPKTISHAETLIKSSMPFLDWSSPDTLIERSEAYLKDGYPVKNPLTTNLVTLRDIKKVRNQIAHMSVESTLDFKKVLKSHFSTVPLRIPRPGEYLLLPCKGNNSTYYLISYMDTMEDVAKQMT